MNKNGESIFSANSVVSDGIWPIHTVLYVLIAYKVGKNQTKNEGARVVTTLYSYILGALYSVVGCGG